MAPASSLPFLQELKTVAKQRNRSKHGMWMPVTGEMVEINGIEVLSHIHAYQTSRGAQQMIPRFKLCVPNTALLNDCLKMNGAKPKRTRNDAFKALMAL